MQDQTRTITIDDVSYNVDQFSQGIQHAIGMYNTFAAELQQEQLAAVKTQAAMQTIGTQISEAVKKELAEKEKLSVNGADLLPADETPMNSAEK